MTTIAAIPKDVNKLHVDPENSENLCRSEDLLRYVRDQFLLGFYFIFWCHSSMREFKGISRAFMACKPVLFHHARIQSEWHWQCYVPLGRDIMDWLGSTVKTVFSKDYAYIDPIPKWDEFNLYAHAEAYVSFKVVSAKGWMCYNKNSILELVIVTSVGQGCHLKGPSLKQDEKMATSFI